MADYLSLIPASIRDARAPGWAALLERLGEEDLTPLLIYRIDSVHASALPHLADQFNLLKSAYWKMARTEAEQRAILKQAITLHKKKGTPWAIKQAIKALGFTDADLLARVAQWNQYVVAVRGKYLSPEDFDLLPQAVEEFANARSELLEVGLGALETWEDDGTWGDDAYWGGYLPIERETDTYDTAADWEQGNFERCAPTPGGGVGLETYAADLGTDQGERWTKTDQAGVVGSWVWNTVDKRLETSCNVNGPVASYLTLSEFEAADVHVRARFTQANNIGIVIRYQDDFNFYMLRASDDSGADPGSNVKLFKCVGGVFTALAYVNKNWSRGTPAVFEIVAKGDTIKAFFDGTEALAVADSTFSAAGKVGMRVNGSVVNYCDAFDVNPLSPTFVRPSPAYHPLTGAEFASGAPRFVELAGTVGLMVEEASANKLVADAESFDAGWAPYSGATETLTANQPDPLGGNRATRITTSGGTHVLKFYAPGYTPTNGTKCSEQLWIRNRGTVNVSVFSNLGARSQVITPDSGWQHVKFQDITGDGVGALHIQLRVPAASDNLDVELYAPMMEEKAYCTSPLPGAATRAAEGLTLPAPPFLKPNMGSVVVLAYVDTRLAGDVGASVIRLFNCLGPSPIFRGWTMLKTGTQWRFSTRNDVGSQNNAMSTAVLVPGWHLFVGNYDAAESSLWIDAVKGTFPIANPALPSATPDMASLGGWDSTRDHWNQPLAFAVFYDRPLTQAEQEIIRDTKAPIPGFTGHLPLGEGLAAEASGLWTGPYRHNRIIVPQKTIEVAGVVPAGASITTEHRTKARPSDADGDWTAQADTPSNDLIQTRARLAGRTGTGLELQRLTITPM